MIKNKIISVLALFIVVLALFGFSYAHKQKEIPKLDSQTYKITKIDNGIIYCTSNSIQSTISTDYTKGIKLTKGDTIKVYFPHNDNGMSEITKVEKIKP